MKNYWLKIVLGAVGVFAAGMVFVTLFRKGAVQVNRVMESADPISIPLAFVPFKLNGERVGTINHLKLLRSAPKQFAGADLEVTLADSFDAGRLTRCILVAERITQLNERSTFRCATPRDTVGRDLVPVGAILIRGSGESHQFLAPRAELRNLNDSAPGMADSSAVAERAKADSIAERAQSAADSAMQRAESIRTQVRSLNRRR